MVDDDGERLDWGNDDDEQQPPPPLAYDYSPRQSAYAGAADDAEDAEDAVSLGGDDEDEREYYANHSPEQVPVSGISPLSKPSSSVTHPPKRDAQRQAVAPSRTPSRAKNSPSPARESRPPNSQGKLPPLPLVHGLPPKPTLVPPLFETPSEPGTRASAMANRQRRSNGAGKGIAAPDGGDPLPPDWEMRYPRDGGTVAYYYNIKTDESTWTRPRLPTSGRSSPTKNGDVLDDGLPERTGRSQQPRPSTRDSVSRRVSPPPDQDLSYADRHYRPGEAPLAAPPANPGDRRGERGSGYFPEAIYGQGPSPSPQPAGDGKRRTRSSSPQWDRRARRDLSPTPSQERGMRRDTREEYSYDRQAGGSDSGWGRSQDYPEVAQPATRSSPARRNRRKDDIEPPIRRKDTIEPLIRRKDDIEPPIRRRDDVEPRIRRKDDIEPRIRRKDDIEPRTRRKDDIEPPLRPPPPREPSSRHIDGWAAPSTRPRSPPLHLRELSPPRRNGPSLSPNTGYPAPPSSSMRYERPGSPPPPPVRYRDNVGNDGLPQRRGRDTDTVEPDFDSKRRRLNDEVIPSRRGPNELPSSVTSLPNKPTFVNSWPAGEFEREAQHRKRTPLPPQREQWKNSAQGPPPGPPPANEPYVDRPMPDIVALLGFNPVNQCPPDGRSYDAHVFDLWKRDPDNPHVQAHRRRYEAMAADGPPPPPRNDNTARSTMGGMYSDRMPAAPAPDTTPRAPRAMVPRDSGSYTSAPPLSQTSSFVSRSAGPPLVDSQGPSSSRGGRSRPVPAPPVNEHRRETNVLGRPSSFSRPSEVDPGVLPVPQRTNDLARNLPERPTSRVLDVPVPVPQRGMGRGAPPPPRMTGTNSIPIGPRAPAYDEAPPLEAPSSFRPTNNGHDSYLPPQNMDHVGESSEPYPNQQTRYPRDETLSERPPLDRVGRRLSVTAKDSSRRSAADSPVDERAPTRQTRFGPPTIPMETEAPRIWQTREEARGQGSRLSEDVIRDVPDRALRDDAPTRRHPSPPRGDLPTKRAGQLEERAGRSFAPAPAPPAPMPHPLPEMPPPRTSRAITPPRPAVRRDDDSMLGERAVTGRVHPERACLFDGNEKTPSNSKPVRIRRPLKSPDRGYPDRPVALEDDKVRTLPPKPDDGRMGIGMGMGPPRERSPPPPPAVQNGNGYRPNIRRGTSLLERLNVYEAEEMPPLSSSSSLRDRVGIAEGGLSRSESMMMMMDVDGVAGEDAKGRGPGGSRRRPAKPRRGGRRNGQ